MSKYLMLTLIVATSITVSILVADHFSGGRIRQVFLSTSHTASTAPTPIPSPPASHGAAAMVVEIVWETDAHDVDLHVVDPAGLEFYWEQQSFADHPGEFKEDDSEGPGVERWEITDPPEGTYQVYYNLYLRNGNRSPTSVSGKVLYRGKEYPLSVKELTTEGERVLAGVLRVTGEGELSVDAE